MYLYMYMCVLFIDLLIVFLCFSLLQRIETDESAKRPDTVQVSEDEIEKSQRILREHVISNDKNRPSQGT